MRVDPAKHKEYTGIHANKGLDDLKKREEEINGTFLAVSEQAGPNWDMSKVTHVDFAGKSPTEVLAKIGAIHAEKSALVDLIKGKEGLTNWSAELARSASDEKGEQAQIGPNGLPVGMQFAGFGHPDERAEIQSIAAYTSDMNEVLKKYRTESGEIRFNREFQFPNTSLVDIFAAAANMRPAPLSTTGVTDADRGAGTFPGSGMWSPEVTRSGRMIDDMLRPIQITDLLPVITTDQAAYKYTVEKYAGAAPKDGAYDEKAPRVPGADPGAALGLARPEDGPLKKVKFRVEDEIAPIQSIGAMTDVTLEQLQDVPTVRQYLRRRIPFLVRQDVDGQIWNGTGANNQLKGLLRTTGILTRAQGAGETGLDAIKRSLTVCRVQGQCMPGPVVLHPYDWDEITLMKTQDGQYLYGNPGRGEITPRVWGHPVAQQYITGQGEGMVGDFQNFSVLLSRQGIIIEMTSTNRDDWEHLRYSIRAYVRVGTAYLRAPAFLKVTDLRFQ